MSTEKINSLRKQLREEERKAERKIVNKLFPEVKAKYMGKYFKYRNSYSCPRDDSDYWYIYYKVLSINKGSLRLGANGAFGTCKVLKIEVDKGGEITINPNHETYIQRLGEAIDEAEFMQAFHSIIDIINKIEF